MSALGLRYEACVLTRSLEASCTACRDACPTGAVTLDGARGSVVVRMEACTSCGLCAAACPTDAFTTPFDLNAFLARSSGHVRCGDDGLPCVGALAAEDLLVLAVRLGEVLLEADGACESRSGHAAAERRAGEAQRMLSALGNAARVTWRGALTEVQNEPTKAEVVEPVRRGMLRVLLPKLPAPPPPLKQPDRLPRVQARASDRRRRLLAVLPVPVAPPAPLPEPALGFVSSKRIDADACTMCGMCTNLCPTGALSKTRTAGEIAFDARACVKCRLCHDVCAPHAIANEEMDVSALFASAPRILVRAVVSHCAECGLPYKRPAEDRGMCPRCLEHEREARELTGLRS